MAGTPIFGAHSLLDTWPITVSSEDPNFPKANLIDDRLYTLYKPTSATTPITIECDHGSNLPFDYFMMAGDNLAEVGASIRLEYSTDHIGWSDAIATTPVLPNRVTCRHFSSKIYARYVKLTISGTLSDVPHIGQLQWGEAIVMPYGVRVGFDPMAEELVGASVVSQGGHFLGAVRTVSIRRANLSFEYVPWVLVRGDLVTGFNYFYNNFLKARKPFLFWWNSGAPGDYERDAFFAMLDDGSNVSRPLATPANQLYHHLSFDVIGPSPL